MAKRKAPRRARPAASAAKRAREQAAARKARPVTRKASGGKRPATRTARHKPAARRAAPKPSATRRVTRTAKKAPKRQVAKAPAAKARAPRATRGAPTTKNVAKAKKPASVARTAPPPKAAPKAKAAAPVVRPASAAEQARRKRVLDLDRERRRVQGDDVVSPMPPSSLGLDRSASAARTGRQELRERYDNHTETSPALTGGDVDADWESAYSVGDEAPGGDNPTPDQNNVDDIGVAVGVEYDDNEELEGAERIEERDRHRWEYDPASSDDFDER